MFTPVFRRMTALSCALALLTITTVAQAHGIYVAQRQSEMVFVFGHGSSDETSIPASYKDIVAYDKDGKKTELDITFKNGYAVIPTSEETTLISGTYDNGYWSEQADGEWVKKPKTEVPDAKQGGLYMKYNTAVMSKDSKVGLVTGLPLEIVPLKNPLALKPGDTLPIQVYANGKSLEDAEVVTEFVTDRENNVVKTDKDGKAEIVIRNDGLNVIATKSSEVIEGEPKADKMGKLATLSFVYLPDH